MTKEKTKEIIQNNIANFFSEKNRRDTTEELDVMECLEALNNDALADDFIVSFDCMSNVWTQQDGSTVACYYSRKLLCLVVINPMFDFSFLDVREFAEAVIDANNEALELESKIKVDVSAQ